MSPTRITPGPGQESVWEYPRPPQVERTDKRVRVVFNGETIADTTQALRVLETSHPPVYYLPIEALRPGVLHPTARRTFCEFKGQASYYDVQVGERRAPAAAWFYPDPMRGYEEIKNYVAFYPNRMDGCFVDEERVQSQEGDFYGGWITRDIVGPFKGGPGTMGW